MQSRDRNVERVEAKMKEWGAKIEAAVRRAEAAGGDALDDYRRRVDALRVQRAEAQTRLDEFKAAGSDTWEAFRAGIEIAWGDLEVAVKALAREDPSPRSPARKASRRSGTTRSKAPAPIPKAPARRRSVGR